MRGKVRNVKVLAAFLAESGSRSHFIKPGSPWQNSFVESFHSNLRSDFLDVEVFAHPADAQIKTAVNRHYYNEVRPHSSLGKKPPAVFAQTHPAGIQSRSTIKEFSS